MPRLALPALVLAFFLAPGAHAQDLPAPGDGFTWEQVGDAALNPDGLVFGPDSTLWATGRRADASGPWGPYRLDLSGGFPGVWVYSGHSTHSYDGHILVLGRGPQGDTLLVSRSGITRRSVDGGQTWEQVHNRGGGGLYEVPAGYPHAGRIFTGGSAAAHASSIGYSDDRGATFTEAVVPSPGGNTASAEDFAAFPPGSDHPGRLLATGRWGVIVSDDGGRTWRESGLWRAVHYSGEGIAVVERPGGGGGAVVGGYVNLEPYGRVWSSADGGETWEPWGGGTPLPEGPPVGGSPRGVLSLGGASALVVLYGGTIYRSDDAGETWTAVGRAPEIRADGSGRITLRLAVLGPDRRLYVGLGEVGSGFDEGWVWRTRERLEPAP